MNGVFFIGDEKTRCASDCYFTDKYTKDLKDSLGQLWEKGTVRVAWQIGLSITIRTTLGLKVPIVLAPAGRPPQGRLSASSSIRTTR